MGKYKRKLGARHYRDYSAETLDAALNAMRSGLSSRRAEEKFNIPRRTLLLKIKKKHMKPVGRPTALDEIEERHVVDVLIASAEYGCPMTQTEVQMVIKSYLDNKDVRNPAFQNNLPGKQWVENFVTRHKNLLSKRHCQNIKRKRAEKSDEEMTAYFENLKNTIENIKPEFILNYDETNLSDDPGSNKCLFARGSKYAEMNTNFTKSAISIMFAGTASGTLLPLYVVYKSDRIYDQWVSGGPAGTIYNRTKSGWFDAATFHDWFNKIIIPWARTSQEPKSIIGDNLSSHLNIEVIRSCQRYNIRFVFLPPNATHITQPLDVSFFHPLKVAWRKILREIKLKHPRQNCVEKSKFPGMLSRLLKEIKLKAKTNLQSGFRATGIYPLNPDEVLKKLPNARFGKKVSREIDSALLTFLQEQRSPTQEVRKTSKKMLKVAAGCSVTEEDLTKPSTSNQQELTDKEDSNSEPDDRDGERDAENDETQEINDCDINQGSFVIVQFATKKSIYHYVGAVLETPDSNETDNFVIKFLVKTGAGFIFPDKDDISEISPLDITEQLETPSIDRRGVYTFRMLPSKYNYR